MNTDARFTTWTEYFGPLVTVEDTLPSGIVRRSTVYGFENISEDHKAGTIANPPETTGAFFGYVTEGNVAITDRHGITHLKKGEYFVVPAPAGFTFTPGTRVVAIHSAPFTPLRTFGGPIEPKGRLRYIDGCSDSLIIAPPKFEDPCLNLLHFPPGIHQTAHTHPSIRCGAIANGAGYCIDGDGTKLDLLPGMIWIIPQGVVHSFHTADSGQELNVIAYHPDTDHGPEDETHPMLNRTWVDGEKVDNTTDEHISADILVTEQMLAL